MSGTFKFAAAGIFILTLQLIPVSSLVLGATSGNPHSFFTQGYLLTSKRKARSAPHCTECHVPVTDDRPLIWDKLPNSIENYGVIGNQCASCHDGVSIVDRNVDAGLTVFNSASHGFDPAQAPEDTDMKSTGLPYTPGNYIKCLDCHDPHQTRYRPLLRVPVIGMCQRCHKSKEHEGFGTENVTGTHPVGIDPFDNTGGPSPIEVDEDFSVPFPESYPQTNAYLSSLGHWTLGGHLTFGSYGRVECSTCHSFHGVENFGPNPALLSKEPVNIVSNEFCEGCHRGTRGDDKEEPPYPNPGGTTTGRTYHPVDDDEANSIGWNVAIADTTERSYYQWGGIDPDSEKPVLLCTTCHVAHNGMENSPALVAIADTTIDEGVETFCEICHRDPPVGHHGYADTIITAGNMQQMLESNAQNLGHTYGELYYDRIYCSYCHKAHNAGFGGIEPNYIPILVDSSMEICMNCHQMGVSHFMGDPTLSSTFGKTQPSLYYGIWPDTGLYSKYESSQGNPSSQNGEVAEVPTIITCQSCHYLGQVDADQGLQYRLLAPGGEEEEWILGNPEGYLCTGCHGEAPATVGEGKTHPLIRADGLNYPVLPSQLESYETTVSYTENTRMNCHSCHRAHMADVQGGTYILKISDGNNTNPNAIQPHVIYTRLCRSCHDN